eukprot:TRINITY_DN15954_c0_g1_i3.p2 TRINITY_DN15954_c0_g1~~TRINITY_DN15954_c0_g1_i3.p2  ORF type:complete len:126 (-),score=39.26 TRINITY_DN15954_c0_g1_i3:40-417(-)
MRDGRFFFSFVLFCVICFFFLMIRRPPRSTQGVSSAASDVYKRQYQRRVHGLVENTVVILEKINEEDGIAICINKGLMGIFPLDAIQIGSVVRQKGATDSHRPSCLLYTSPSPRDLSTSRMPSSA